MAIVFWDARGIIHTITFRRSKRSMAITSLIGPFQQHLKKKCPYLTKKKDNARIHMCPAPIAKFNEFRYELLPHPAYEYSQDLAPCDYILFPNLKKWFGGKRFITREQLIAETVAYCEGLESNHIIRTA